jgi:endonuclease/exonuclease/phosphatase family metal-dependent hydrolase
MNPIVKSYDDPHGPKFEGQYADRQAADPASIIVVTYNIERGREVEKASQTLQTSEWLRDADIILLQEMDETGVEKIAKVLQANYIYFPASVTRSGHNFGNAILARWPLTDGRKIILPHRNPISHQLRIGVLATVKVCGHDIRTYSVHTEIYSTLSIHRKAQSETIVTDIGPGDDPVIVGGDFNTVSKRSIRRLEEQFSAVGLTRVSSGAGPSVVKYRVRTAADHIFVRNLSKIVSGTVEEADASDHFPVWAQLACQNGGVTGAVKKVP